MSQHDNFRRRDLARNRSACIQSREPSVALVVVFIAAPFQGADTSEDMKMSMRNRVLSSFGRGALLATAAAMALAAVEPSVALAGSARPVNALSVDHGASGNTDISARRRHHGGGGAAAMAAFAGIVGTIGAIAATQERRDYYESGPVYYSGGPAYYDAPAYGYYGGYGVRDPYHYHRYSRGGF
jgi:hypothetical protein